VLHYYLGGFRFPCVFGFKTRFWSDEAKEEAPPTETNQLQIHH
jgi:hypothetical protein